MTKPRSNHSAKLDSAVGRLQAEVDLPQHVMMLLEAAAYAVHAASEGLDDVLDQLIGMAVESLVDDDTSHRSAFSKLGRSAEVPSDVENAALEYEKAAEKLLVNLVGDEDAQKAMKDNAIYLMFMTQEGHGVGVWDGRLDDALGDEGVKTLEDGLKNDEPLNKAHDDLVSAIDSAAYEQVNDAIDDWVLEVNHGVQDKITEAEENEMNPDRLGDYFPDGVGPDVEYTYSGLQGFADARNVRDHYVGSLAEVVGQALAQGLPEDKIYAAIEDVGDPVFVKGFRATKNAIASTGEVGDIDVTIDLNSIKIDNHHGHPLTAADVYAILSGPLGEKLGEDGRAWKLDFTAEGSEVVTTGHIDGYIAWVCDPKKLAAHLKLKPKAEPSGDEG